jgi:putative CocE/NonD family hydrolase
MYTQEWAMMQLGAVNDIAAGTRASASAVLDAATKGRWEIGRWHGHLPVGELPPLPREAAPWYYGWLEHPDHDGWWADRDVAARYDRLNLPGLHLVGWFDRFCRSTVANYQAMRRGGSGPPQQLVIGPWPHGVPVINGSGDRYFGVKADVDCRALVLGWYERWLRDAEVDASDGARDAEAPEPEVRYYLMGADEWHVAPSWPLPNAEPTPFHLRSGGAANSARGDGRLEREPPPPHEPADTYVYDPADPTPSVPGRMMRPWGTVDQGPIEARSDVLCYSTPPLDAPVDVVGPVTARPWAVTDAVDTDWLMKLVDVYPDGYVLRLAEGLIRARYRDSQAAPSPLEPGSAVCYEIDVGPVGNRFEVGHRIRVEVASASFPQFDRNMNTGRPFGVETSCVPARQRILHDADHPSQVVLPIVSRE